MKKALTVIFAVLMLAISFAGCANNNDNSKEALIPTDDAVITGTNAIAYIEKNYTAEDLGLEAIKDEYRFMVANNGFKHNDKYYVRVVANIQTLQEGVTGEGGANTYSLDTVGEYLISFDGKEVLMKDMKTADTYIKLETKAVDYSQKEANSQKAE